jgi:hypothetical protein
MEKSERRCKALGLEGKPFFTIRRLWSRVEAKLDEYFSSTGE